jgi:hypothetical protein
MMNLSALLNLSDDFGVDRDSIFHKGAKNPQTCKVVYDYSPGPNSSLKQVTYKTLASGC